MPDDIDPNAASGFDFSSLNSGAPSSSQSGGAPDVSGGYHITKPPPPLPNEPDQSLLARAGIAEGGPSPEGQTAVIRAILQRQAESGETIPQILTKPGQIEAYWRGGLQNIDTSSPAYQRALGIAQTATPSPGIDSWGNEAVIKQRGWGKLPFDPSTGTLIGGQLFGNGNYGKGSAASAAPADSDLFTLNATDQATWDKAHPQTAAPPAGAAKVANVPVLDQVAATVAQHQLANAQSGNAQWPIYDEANDVYRNKDGSIAALGQGGTPPSRGPNGEIQIDVNQSTNPDAIRSWMRTHPLDPSNGGVTNAGAGPQDTSLGRGGVGSEQGLANVGNSLVGMQAALKSNPITNALLTGFSPGQAAVTPEELRADLARGVLNRNTNDINLGGSEAYNLGKFGGEVAGTIPVMAATEGLGSGALGAFAPDFAGGLTAASTGNKLLQFPERLAGSALTGARYGGEGAALTSAGSSQPTSEQIAQGAGFGAVVNPLIGAVTAPVRGLANFVAPHLETFTNEGKEAILNRNMTAAMEGGNTTPDMTQYVPGEPPPTWAQATHNPAMAVTERDMRATDPVGVGNVFDAHEKAANAARQNFLTQIAGTPGDVEAAEAARDSVTTPMREAAFARKSPTDPTPVVQLIDNILASPAGKSNAVQSALSDVREKLFTSSPIKIPGSAPIQQLETDPEQLYGVRKAIDQSLSSKAPITDTNKDARLAAGQLMQVKNALDPVIEQGAPGFQSYINTYSQMSKPANAMSYLQKLNTDNAMDNMTLGKVNTAITKIERDRASPGLTGADDISDQQLQGLYNLRSSLQRANVGGALQATGRGNQITGNLKTNTLADAITNPIAGAVAGHVAGSTGILGVTALTAGKFALEAQKREIQNRLVSRMLNAENAAGALNKFGVGPGQALQGQPVQNLLARNLIAASRSNAKFGPFSSQGGQSPLHPALVPTQ